jgi:lipopolysaccharide transport system ATP-binding protein
MRSIEINQPASNPSVIAENTHRPTPADNLIISLQNVSKMYPLYATPQARLRQSLWHTLPKFLRGHRTPQFYREFWALRNVSFEVKKGESVGIIGRNGSGKSTLLQIIAGILTPTVGQAQVHGRVAALLELGSGFNPEFTGRENVYLNGAILGLAQAEISSIFDDIAAFADIGQFMDLPVKLYSSGMAVRLAFAVQAFVPKEVLIVDEALSVGDMAFQRKCLGLLERFKENGGMVLLVSHDTQTIVRQCDRCLMLHQGELIADEASKSATDLYQKLMFSPPSQVAAILSGIRQDNKAAALPSRSNGTPAPADSQPDHRPDQPALEPAAWFNPDLPRPEEIIYGNGTADIFECGMYNRDRNRVNVLVVGQRYQWQYKVRFYQDARKVHFGMMLKTIDGLDAASIASFREQSYFDFISAGSVYEVTFELTINLVPGDYFLNVGVGGRIDGEDTYLQRRVDTAMVRVIPCDTRESYGLAYVAPRFSYRRQAENEMDTPA